MPTIHVIFDPNDRITAGPPDHLKRLGASAATMSIATVEVEPETIQQTAEALAALLLNAIARDQQLWQRNDGMYLSGGFKPAPPRR